ncbi:competence/damage-inducible protein A [Halorubellus sp. PRR65]|uniref:competence/damage-inducible protein A n=1 Tax=Halorubellus sp. PRR65 TaxID=3098148 RepID=UPI002B263693|nr:competence/damage-inducible protein A [Halorubellus sp. PRR65]
MEVAIVTVGDEVLAGDTVNTNANWLAGELAARGALVARILTVPDDRAVIADAVREYADAFDAVVCTGGIGGTPDDVTVEAVADALDRDLEVDPVQRERLEARAEAFRDANPDLVEEYDFQLNLDAAATLPEGAESITTDESWSPGCVVENVYVLPGIPGEMRAMFDVIADAFAGDATSEVVRTWTPEGALLDVIDGVRERFDVRVGSYPRGDDTPGRVKVTGTDPDAVAAAAAFVRDRIDVAD